MVQVCATQPIFELEVCEHKFYDSENSEQISKKGNLNISKIFSLLKSLTGNLIKEH